MSVRPSTRVVTWHRHAAVVLTHDDTEVVVVPELGMLVAAFVVDGFDHVARPGGPQAVRGGHTTGVPLLYPWANRLGRRAYDACGRHVSLRGLTLHEDPAGLPMHGTMLGRRGWDVTGLQPGRMSARFAFDDEALLASFPFPHTVTVDVRVGRRRVRVDTAVHADAGPVPVSFGWHPYWRIPGRRDEWTVGLPAVAHARLDRRGIPTGRVRPEPAGAIGLAGNELDDLYDLADERAATLSGPAGRLRVEMDGGYPNLQVYAPRGRDFCCIEPMTAPTNALVTGDHPEARAGETFAASFTATVLHP
jgi:galactose mutarotase-like enzyme